jgi:hypothetical protein
MGKVLIVAIICFLLFGCSEESDIQYKMVVIDWEQLHDPNISVNLQEKPIYILNGEEPMKNSFEIGLRIETTEKYSEYDIIVTLFDKQGKILKTYPLHTSLELQEDSWKGILSYGYSDHIPELKELNKYQDIRIKLLLTDTKCCVSDYKGIEEQLHIAHRAVSYS